LFSPRGWAAVAVCAIATPLLFGIWPTSLHRLLPFILLAWMGAFIGGGAIMVLRGSGEAEAAGDAPREEPKDGPPSS
jgi:hypothetical protein